MTCIRCGANPPTQEGFCEDCVVLTLLEWKIRKTEYVELIQG